MALQRWQAAWRSWAYTPLTCPSERIFRPSWSGAQLPGLSGGHQLRWTASLDYFFFFWHWTLETILLLVFDKTQAPASGSQLTLRGEVKGMFSVRNILAVRVLARWRTEKTTLQHKDNILIWILLHNYSKHVDSRTSVSASVAVYFCCFGGEQENSCCFPQWNQSFECTLLAWFEGLCVFLIIILFVSDHK